MIAVSDATMAILQGGGFTMRARATAVLDGVVVAANVPIIDGGEEYDASLSVPERVTISVPRVADGVNWTPTLASSPLAAFGQRLRIQLGVGIGQDGVEWFDRGEFVINQSDVDGDRVTVQAVGLLALVDEARLVSPFQPTGTFVSTLRGLVEPALTLAVSAALVDRAVPTGINFDEDRLGAVQELLDAWPARMLTQPDGTLLIYPDADPAVASYALLSKNTPASTQRATITRFEGGSTRDGAYNCVVARGTAPDGGQVQGVAYDTSNSATAYGGPFNPLPVPFYFSSPLLTTSGQCQAAAKTILARKARRAYGRWDSEVVIMPLLTGEDGITVWPTTEAKDSFLTVVDTMTLPYVPNGPQNLTLRSVPRA